VEVWRLGRGATEAILLDRESVLSWTPEQGRVALEIDLSDLFAAE
jgi:hypothetical protein